METRAFATAFVALLAVAACSGSPLSSRYKAAERAADPVASAAVEMRDAAGAHRLVLLGEMHGTREVPALMAALVDLYAEAGPVRLGLELPHAQQAALDAWLAGGDRDAARAAMAAADPGWSRPEQANDGRRNVEVFALLDRLREAKARGRDVGVLAFDVPGQPGEAAARDERMATRIREAYAAEPDARWIVVAGNVHAMKFKPSACPDCQTPMAAHLSDLSPFSVNVYANAGAFHGCMPERPCARMPVTGDAGSSGPVGDPETPFDYSLVLPRFTPAELP